MDQSAPPQSGRTGTETRDGACARVGPGCGRIGRPAFDRVEQRPDGREANLGSTDVTDALAADLALITAFLKPTTSASDWVGSIGIGIVVLARRTPPRSPP